MNENISKVAEPTTTAKATTPVANNKKTADDIYKIICDADIIEGSNAIAAYILYIFIKKVAENYGKYFENECVCTFTSIGVNYEGRYLTTYDSEGIPVSTEYDEDNYNLPELDASYDMMVGDTDAGFIYDCVSDFIYGPAPDEGDADVEAREATIKFFEELLAEEWGFTEVSLALEYDYTKIGVKR